MTRSDEAELHVPKLAWREVQSRLLTYWEAQEAPHISIMGQTRSGKTYLVKNGILPLTRNDRVLFIDSKGGGDPTSQGLGKPVREIPSTFKRNIWNLWRKPEAYEHHYRLVVWDGPQNTGRARDQVQRALERVREEKDWVVVFDELRHVTDPQAPGLHLRPYYEEIILRGGSRRIASISCSQEPRWCPGSFYTQSNFYFFSRMEDEATHKRIAEVGSQKQLVPIVKNIPRRQWLYMDNMDEDGQRFYAHTRVEKGN